MLKIIECNKEYADVEDIMAQINSFLMFANNRDINDDLRRWRDFEENLSDVNGKFDVGAELDVDCGLGWTGKAKYKLKHIIYRMIVWYIRPIIQNQKKFNLAVMRTMNDEYRVLKSISARNMELQRRVEELEDLLKGTQDE